MPTYRSSDELNNEREAVLTFNSISRKAGIIDFKASQAIPFLRKALEKDIQYYTTPETFNELLAAYKTRTSNNAEYEKILTNLVQKQSDLAYPYMLVVIKYFLIEDETYLINKDWVPEPTHYNKLAYMLYGKQEYTSLTNKEFEYISLILSVNFETIRLLKERNGDELKDGSVITKLQDKFKNDQEITHDSIIEIYQEDFKSSFPAPTQLHPTIKELHTLAEHIYQVENSALNTKEKAYLALVLKGEFGKILKTKQIRDEIGDQDIVTALKNMVDTGLVISCKDILFCYKTYFKEDKPLPNKIDITQPTRVETSRYVEKLATEKDLELVGEL